MTQKPLLQYLKQKQYWVNALMTMFFVLYINRMYSGGDMMKRKICFIFELLLKIATIIFAFWGVCLQARDDGGFIRSNTYSACLLC